MDTYKWGQELEAIVLFSIPRVHAIPISQHEADLHNPCRAGCHQRITENSVHHRAQRQVLRVRTHRPTRDDNDNSRNQVPPRSPISLPRKPHTH